MSDSLNTAKNLQTIQNHALMGSGTISNFVIFLDFLMKLIVPDPITVTV